MRSGALSILLLLGFAGACGESESEPARRGRILAAVAAESLAALERDSLARAKQESVNRAQPGYVVDSTLSIEEELRRFRADLSSRPTALVDGESSRAALVTAFVRALERSDTASVQGLAITRAEYAYLVYPASPLMAPPYRHPPALAWFQLQMSNRTGITRLFRRLGGQRLGVIDHQCDAPPERQGVNTVWAGCVVRRVRAPGDTAREQLFGTILERDGRFKLLSLATQF